MVARNGKYFFKYLRAIVVSRDSMLECKLRSLIPRKRCHAPQKPYTDERDVVSAWYRLHMFIHNDASRDRESFVRSVAFKKSSWSQHPIQKSWDILVEGGTLDCILVLGLL